MLEINFKYNNQTFPNKCHLDDKIKDICQNFAEKNILEIDNLIFINKGTQINFKLDLLVKQEFNLLNDQQNQILKTEEILVYENPFYIKLTCSDQSDYITKITLNEKMKDILEKYAESKKLDINKISFSYNEKVYLSEELSNKTVNSIVNKADKKDKVIRGQIIYEKDNSSDSINKILNIDEETLKNNKKYNKKDDKKNISYLFNSRILYNEQNENFYDISISKWIDHTSKYGLAYLLSNGNVGVYFNDSTKIIYRPNGTKFIYIEGKAEKNPEKITTHTLNEEFSKDLNKKFLLLKHFKVILLKEDKNIEIETKESENIDENEYVIIDKWLVTKEAFIFSLTNNSVQAIFFDKTEIYFSCSNRTLKYLDEKGQMNSYPLYTAVESNEHDIKKRLNYMKNVLAHIKKEKSNKSGDKIGDK